ncbi:MAG: thermonuclease family protein [Gemmatimonadota bacterium]
MSVPPLVHAHPLFHGPRLLRAFSLPFPLPHARAFALARAVLSLLSLHSVLVLSALLTFLGVEADAAVAQASSSCTVERIIDGDTFVCESGERVRLILVDTPEMADEPLGRMARSFLRDLIPPGTEVTLEMDVGERDRYGRLLAYVRLSDGRMVNRVLAREGYAQVMVVQPNVRHVETIRAAVDSARAEGAGLWDDSPGFGRSPGVEPTPRRRDGSGGSCHPAYPGVCIPPPPPDLDCGDISHRRFQVRPPDPHRFDGDGDGVGCEGL